MSLHAAAAAAAKLLQSCPTLCDPIWQPTRLLCPWDSPGKSTGVSCHFLLPTSLQRNDINVNSQHLVRHFSSLIRQYSLTTLLISIPTLRYLLYVFYLISSQ